LRYDLALLGAGLHNSLIGLALHRAQPGLRLLFLEAAPGAPSGRGWSCHAGELGGALPDWLEPALAARWPNFELRFPGWQRRLGGEYLSLESQRLQRLLEANRCDQFELVHGATVQRVAGERIELADGRTFSAQRIIDGRGAEPSLAQTAGFQKFLGQVLHCARPHGLSRPLLMDATVPQLDGYRFVYVLPLSHERLLVEDTYFADSPQLDAERLRGRIAEYVQSQGWSIEAVEREERGVLPMPWRRLPSAFGPAGLRSGYRGGWFHPTTGYSLGLGIRLAQRLAAQPALLEDSRALARWADAQRRGARFALLLNELQFRWYPPQCRRSIYERFFALPDDLIERFFALRSTRRDRWRILCGRPPRGLSLRWRLQASPRTRPSFAP
jgi:lycopene beta-cyclase